MVISPMKEGAETSKMLGKMSRKPWWFPHVQYGSETGFKCPNKSNPLKPEHPWDNWNRENLGLSHTIIHCKWDYLKRKYGIWDNPQYLWMGLSILFQIIGLALGLSHIYTWAIPPIKRNDLFHEPFGRWSCQFIRKILIKQWRFRPRKSIELDARFPWKSSIYHMKYLINVPFTS